MHVGNLIQWIPKKWLTRPQWRRDYMKRTKSVLNTGFKLTTLALVTTLAAPVTLAQDAGWYTGFNIGRSRSDVDGAAIVSGLNSAGFATNSFDKDKREIGWKGLAGYKFSPRIAVEGSYFDLGTFSFSAGTQPPAGQRADINLRGFGLDVVGNLGLTESLSLIGRAGVHSMRVGQVFGTNMPAGGFVDSNDRSARGKVGLGLQYQVTDAVAFRAEMERYWLPNNLTTTRYADMASVGLVFTFGVKPAPVVAEAAPTPPPPPPPPAPAPTILEVSLQAEALFDFDRSELKPEALQELQRLVGQINGLNYDQVSIVGHTDRIGTREYNLGLSTRRANAVRDYLVNAGIPGARVTATGVANDEPVLPSSACRNTGSAAAQIACLAPDRRVVVVITGTRQQ
jgi:OmpA-OmpF porin, OOP family